MNEPGRGWAALFYDGAILIAIAIAMILVAMAAANAAVLVSVSKTQPIARKASTATGQVNPILFVTQWPIPDSFATIASSFANHLPQVVRAGRGGDLMIWYPDGTLRNLTQEAGYGSAGMQGANSISVRDPYVSWDASKAVFSMVIGAPVRQYVEPVTYWQLYEVTGLQEGGHATITKVANQPATNNNVQPSYASDNGILFATDRTHNDAALYPQLDEYESTATTTGVWKLNTDGTLWQVTDSPSGIQYPSVDSFGRIVYTQWDHLQQDQQCDHPPSPGKPPPGCFNAADESATAAHLAPIDVFPESRVLTVGNLNPQTFNIFFPWSTNQDGTSQEIVNHIGRHELVSYFSRNFTDDPALHDFTPGTRTNPNTINNFLQTSVDPTNGNYIGVDAEEFFTDGAGQIISLNAPIHVPANTLKITYLTPRSASVFYAPGTPVPPDFDGRYRNASRLSNGNLLAAYTNNPDKDHNAGTATSPIPQYQFRIRILTQSADGLFHPGQALTGATGVVKSISFYDPNAVQSYNGPLWELNPVEVVARPVPPETTTGLQAPELTAFSAAGVDPNAFKAWLVQHNLALFDSRNVTSRDAADHQQPYNLHVPGGTQTVGNNGKLYDITYWQLLQGDAIRGEAIKTGRRKLAQPLHDATALAAMPPSAGPPGSVTIAPDGSVAAIVPARTAMTWQTTAADGTPIVRERYWVTAQPGEIRTCESCHGVNTVNQAGLPPPTNSPAALTTLLAYWKVNNGGGGVCTNPQPSMTPICAGGGNQTGGTWTQAAFPGCGWTYVGGMCPAQVCTNPQPTTTPVCPGGGNQTGGTWGESAFPACVWTYAGGACPIVQTPVTCPAGSWIFVAPNPVPSPYQPAVQCTAYH